MLGRRQTLRGMVVLVGLEWHRRPLSTGERWNPSMDDAIGIQVELRLMQRQV